MAKQFISRETLFLLIYKHFTALYLHYFRILLAVYVTFSSLFIILWTFTGMAFSEPQHRNREKPRDGEGTQVAQWINTGMLLSSVW